MRELSEDERGLVATAILHGRFPPKPEYLPACHRLYKRGWFDLEIVDDLVTFDLSERGVQALELGVPLDEAKHSLN